jgi:hypothetical protein
MPEQVTYFAIIDHRATREEPAGIARRRRPDEGGFEDEALGRDLTWHFTPLIVEWERAESTPDLEEIPEEEAERIIERFRERWAGLGA